ncbi:DUF4085 family protein [Paenibacillus xylanivorans]|uniref:DUF4085 domain-containing protein n=1 Tax=Paenibacillus xylanivorans TaxID=1705561 RepID=A0A0N0C557_9BACL|nr:DUF4085 family protein [Paenibacillus xylanivorans]KOY16801.1 hypothetical protein AMS66_07925 [Paenibacillus xylanivorans]
MKYLTKDWYETCQQTGLHFGLRVHNGALFQRLYKRKEKEHIKQEREIYDIDPRYMLEHDGQVLTRVDKAFSGEEVAEEDQMVYHMPPEERTHIENLIAEYDACPPFDEKKCKEEYKEAMEWNFQYKAEHLPKELVEQIADIRVFTLGYCTREILQQLKKQSAENTKEMDRVSKEYMEAILAQDIPGEIHSRVQFHDCTVTELLTGDEVVIRFDTHGGFTNINKVTLVAPEIIKQEGEIVGSYWLYQELYRIDQGYELHVLFGGEHMPELIVRCADILVEVE